MLESFFSICLEAKGESFGGRKRLALIEGRKKPDERDDPVIAPIRGGNVKPKGEKRERRNENE